MDLAASIQAVTEDRHAGDGPRAVPRRPASTNWSWPAASRSTASPTAGSCAKARSTTSGSSRRPAMPAARSARRCSSGTSCSRSRVRSAARIDRRAASSGRASIPTEIRAVPRRQRNPAISSQTLRRICSGTSCDLLVGGQDRRLVPRADGVRPPGARRPQHPRRSAVAPHAGDDEPEDQVPRELPPVCAVSCFRTRRIDGSSCEPGQESPYMLLVAPVSTEHRMPVDPDDSRRRCTATRTCGTA